MRRAGYLFFFWMVAGLASAAEALPEVLWYRLDYPPTYILSGSYRNHGFGDLRDEFLMRELAEFSHRRAVANVARLMEEFHNRPNVCNTAMQKTPEREQFILFSEPIAELLPNGLITLASRKAEFSPFLNERGELRLGELIRAQKFRIAVAADRSYGTAIDTVLQTGRTSGVVQPYFKGDIFASGLLQLKGRREADATVGYAIELNWTTQRFNLAAADFWFVPVEGMTQLMRSHVGCSRSPVGEAVIARVNALIRAGKITRLTERAYLDWLPTEIRPYYQQLRRAEHR